MIVNAEVMMVTFRRYIRHTKVGNFTLQKILQYFDSNAEKFGIPHVPSAKVRLFWERGRVELDHSNAFREELQSYLDYLREREQSYKVGFEKFLEAMKEGLQIFKEEYPNATKEEMDAFLDELSKDAHSKFHAIKDYEPKTLKE